VTVGYLFVEKFLPSRDLEDLCLALAPKRQQEQDKKGKTNFVHNLIITSDMFKGLIFRKK